MKKLKVIRRWDYSNFMRAVKFDKIECTYIGDDGKAHIEPFINILEESKINSSLIKRMGSIKCRGKDIRYLVAMAFVDYNVKCLDSVPKEFYSMSLFKLALDKGYPLADLPYIDELERRTIFIENNNGEKIATFTAWWRYTGERRHPFMEWVAVKPEYQGKGLGKALISEGVKLMIAIEGDCDMYIPTQTWSYKAIRLYRWAGFGFETEEKFPGGIKNETLEGIKVIKNLI